MREMIELAHGRLGRPESVLPDFARYLEEGDLDPDEERWARAEQAALERLVGEGDV